MGRGTYILSIVLTFLTFALIYLCGYTNGVSKCADNKVIVHDTLVNEVIVREYVDRPVLRYIERVRIDSVSVPVVGGRDTVYAEIPIERRVYAEDSLYKAVVTGYNPVLESLTLYPTIKTITIMDREKVDLPRFSFGVTVGPSALVTPSGNIYVGAGVTAGVQYRF